MKPEGSYVEKTVLTRVVFSAETDLKAVVLHLLLLFPLLLFPELLK